MLLVETASKSFVLKQSLPKLRVEQDWYSDRERIFREAEALKEAQVFWPEGGAPRLMFEDRENYLIAMTAAASSSTTWKTELLAGLGRPETAQRIGSLLGRMIRGSWYSPEALWRFGDLSVFDQLRLDAYYRSTASRHPDLQGYFQHLIDNCRNRRCSLVHGDFSPKNVLVSGPEVMIIDFEAIHFGDPAFDSAFILNHLLLKCFHRPDDAPSFAHLANVLFSAAVQELPPTEWFEPSTVEHLAGLLLARVDGKSPVEYLSCAAKQDRVRQFARRLILAPPATVQEVFERLSR